MLYPTFVSIPALTSRTFFINATRSKKIPTNLRYNNMIHTSNKESSSNQSYFRYYQNLEAVTIQVAISFYKSKKSPKQEGWCVKMIPTLTRHCLLQSRRFKSTSATSKPVAIFLNCSRLDYDRALDFSRLSEIVDFRRNDKDYVTDPQELVSLVNDSKAEIVITKEMKVPAACVEKFSDSVRLLCEAGTGYNNIPILTAQAKGITVCNIPTYSTDAVAHMAITYIMNLSIRMFEQQAMLQRGDRSNFTGSFTLPLVELGDKTLGLAGGSGLIGSKVCRSIRNCG